MQSIRSRWRAQYLLNACIDAGLLGCWVWTPPPRVRARADIEGMDGWRCSLTRLFLALSLYVSRQEWARVLALPRRITEEVQVRYILEQPALPSGVALQLRYHDVESLRCIVVDEAHATQPALIIQKDGKVVCLRCSSTVWYSTGLLQCVVHEPLM